MTPEFKTPVSMKVTKEQYLYLKPKLQELGYDFAPFYEEIDLSDEHPEYCYLATNYNPEDPSSVAIDQTIRDTHLEEYNPELFLAIAAMTKGTKWIVGEYLYYDQRNLIFKCIKNDYGANSTEGLAGVDNTHLYRKVSLEEIFKIFEKETSKTGKTPFVLPKPFGYKGYEFVVNSPEHSKAIQKRLFELGYSWAGNDTNTQYINSTYLHTWNEDSDLSHGSRAMDEWKQITLDDLYI